jgi:hypothetical protein
MLVVRLSQLISMVLKNPRSEQPMMIPYFWAGSIRSWRVPADLPEALSL